MKKALTGLCLSGALVIGLTGSGYAWGCGPNKKCPTTTTTTSTTTTTESTTTTTSTSTTTTTVPETTTTTTPEITTTTVEKPQHKPIKFTG